MGGASWVGLCQVGSGGRTEQWGQRDLRAQLLAADGATSAPTADSGFSRNKQSA